MSGDPLGYIALAGIGIAVLAWRRRAGPTTPATPTPGPANKEDPARAPVMDPGEQDEDGGQVRAELPGPTLPAMSEPEPQPTLRRLDTVYVRCENATHSPDSTPTVTLTRDRIVAVGLTLHRQGWSDTPHANLCPVCNPHGRDLTTVHIRCDTPGCGERAGMRLTDLAGAFGHCHFDGWRNRGHRVVCPYCSGVREHRNA